MSLDKLAEIVGSDNALDTSSLLDEYEGDLSFAEKSRPACVARPGNIAELQRIVNWANDTLTPLVPVSSGSPHFRGDTVPGADGAVIVDMRRMDRIIRVDYRNRVAMVEPGVTFGMLQEELIKKGLCAYMPLLPRESKSVIGSMLEREPIIRPGHHWDSCDPLLCTEVVFGTGDKFRTGEASGPDTVEEQWEMDRVQMNPFGHSHVDFHRLLSGAQGTLGIVTWATLKCSYASELSRSLLVPSQTIEPLIELAYKFTLYRFGGAMFILNSMNLACILGRNIDDITEIIQGFPPWILFASFEGYGILPEEKAACEEEDFMEIAHSYDLKPSASIADVNAEELSALLPHPSSEPYWKNRFKGAFQDLFFLTTLDKCADFMAVINKMTGKYNFTSENIGIYIQPIVQGTGCHCEFNLYYDPANANDEEEIKRIITAGSEDIAEIGGFFSRPYTVWKDAAYRRAPGTMDIQRNVKKIFDPNGILNPGKLCF